MRAWTTLEIAEAAAMWQDGRTAYELAALLGRGVQSVKHMIRHNRGQFPARRPERNQGNVATVKRGIVMSAFLHRRIEAEAKLRGVSQAYLIRQALREKFIQKGRAS